MPRVRVVTSTSSSSCLRTASHAALCSILTARQPRRDAPRRRLSRKLKQVTSHSEGAPIYYMTARVAFKKRKVVHERVVWIVSVFTNPNDIRRYDGKTMWRLGLELYGKNAKAEKQIIIREILDKKYISHSTLTIDEHKESNQAEVQRA